MWGGELRGARGLGREEVRRRGERKRKIGGEIEREKERGGERERERGRGYESENQRIERFISRLRRSIKISNISISRTLRNIRSDKVRLCRLLDDTYYIYMLSVLITNEDSTLFDIFYVS